MANTIDCPIHGEGELTHVCSHLTEDSAGLGFNRDEPSAENPFPDAWCHNCDLIYQAEGQSEELVEVRILCSGCYERSRIRNTRTDVSFEELESLRWNCSSCEEWHYGPCLDFSYAAPSYWSDEHEAVNENEEFDPACAELPTNLLNHDLCVIEGEDYFVCGLIHLPIIGTNKTLCWGVWGSLSRENFEKLLAVFDDEERAELPPMFSWLSNQIEEYPDTLNLKMYAHFQEPDQRPVFELEPTDHPLAQEYYHGITPERVKEIMMRRLDLPVN